MSGADGADSGESAVVLDLDDHIPPLVGVRQWAAEALADLTDEELGDVLLVVTELVTNAYDHGQHPRQLRMRHSLRPCFVRVEVDDASPDPPILGTSRLGDLRGRGMIIVDRLSKDWGVTPYLNGKTVWAEIICEPQQAE